jgi:hypothetical protein
VLWDRRLIYTHQICLQRGSHCRSPRIGLVDSESLSSRRETVLREQFQLEAELPRGEFEFDMGTYAVTNEWESRLLSSCQFRLYGSTPYNTWVTDEMYSDLRENILFIY